MAKKQEKMKLSWLTVSILCLLLMVPYGVFVKLLSNDINPYLVSAMHYILASLVWLPFIIRYLRKKKVRKVLVKKLPVMLLVSVFISLAFPLYAVAIDASCVSFVEIILLLTPILFSIISIAVTKDKMSRKAIMGLLFAILGGTVMILLPILTGSGAVVAFGLLPAILVLFYVVAAAVEPVYMRKINEEGVPISVINGITCIMCAITSTIYVINDGGLAVFSEYTNLSGAGWLMMLYVGFAATIAFVLRIKAYEHIGTATHATLNYLSSFLSIATPIIILGEIISWEMVVGAMLIITGVALTRKRVSHKTRKTKKKSISRKKHPKPATRRRYT